MNFDQKELQKIVNEQISELALTEDTASAVSQVANLCYQKGYAEGRKEPSDEMLRAVKLVAEALGLPFRGYGQEFFVYSRLRMAVADEFGNERLICKEIGAKIPISIKKISRWLADKATNENIRFEPYSFPNEIARFPREWGIGAVLEYVADLRRTHN